MRLEGPDYPGTSYAATSNGWMETEVFEIYFQATFLKPAGPERPALLICDRHDTHVGLKLIKMTRNERITIFELPPHSSHILQPLDLCVMKSISAWDEELTKWQRHHIGMKLPKKEFLRPIGGVWTKINPSIVQKGFQKAGIFRFDKK
ncbi:hypothetical protein ILUMI_16815 [Ignelater luminosus]|uniref:DDE-1 domain-containing protein n=1 Tax=Ignelater luminosus TaxID=2038154 RepID=A0A8K0CL20_IGNLU|nr:hypothetical protein ILUMI_16815 [Ignelater luminosus]